jgi:hypothetical protein
VRKRDWTHSKAELVFGGLLIVMVAVPAVFVFNNRVLGENLADPVWNQSYHQARQISNCLDSLKIPESELIMINNPPGFFVASGRSSIVIPSNTVDDVLAAGQKYGASVLVLESNHPRALNAIYQNPEYEERLEFVDTCDGALIFQLAE